MVISAMFVKTDSMGRSELLDDEDVLGWSLNPLHWFEDPEITHARTSAKAAAILAEGHAKSTDNFYKSFDKQMGRTIKSAQNNFQGP